MSRMHTMYRDLVTRFATLHLVVTIMVLNIVIGGSEKFLSWWNQQSTSTISRTAPRPQRAARMQMSVKRFRNCLRITSTRIFAAAALGAVNAAVSIIEFVIDFFKRKNMEAQCTRAIRDYGPTTAGTEHHHCIKTAPHVQRHDSAVADSEVEADLVKASSQFHEQAALGRALDTQSQSSMAERLARCEQELAQAAVREVDLRLSAAKMASDWKSIVDRLEAKLKTQVEAREAADWTIQHLETELDRTERQLKRTAMAAAIHIHNVEHRVVFSQAAIQGLTGKLDSANVANKENTELKHELKHARILLSEGYSAQCESAAKISAFSSQISASSTRISSLEAQLKSAEQEAHKQGVYAEMALKLGDIQVDQARTKAAAAGEAKWASAALALAAAMVDRDSWMRRALASERAAKEYRLDSDDLRKIRDKQQYEIQLCETDVEKLREDLERQQLEHQHDIEQLSLDHDKVLVQLSSENERLQRDKQGQCLAIKSHQSHLRLLKRRVR